jgi:hypothetical protein
MNQNDLVVWICVSCIYMTLMMGTMLRLDWVAQVGARSPVLARVTAWSLIGGPASLAVLGIFLIVY